MRERMASSSVALKSAVDREAILELKVQGQRIRQIARKLGVSYPSNTAERLGRVYLRRWSVAKLIPTDHSKFDTAGFMQIQFCRT